MRILIMAFLAYGMAAPSMAQSIPSDLSGSWSIQADAEAARNRRPITGLSIGTQLSIRQTPSEVSIESNTGSENSLVTTVYKLDGSEHAIPGPIGWETRAKSAWDGKAMTVEIRRSVYGPEGELVFNIREIYARNGEMLTLERSQGRTVQKLTYARK